MNIAVILAVVLLTGSSSLTHMDKQQWVEFSLLYSFVVH